MPVGNDHWCDCSACEERYAKLQLLEPATKALLARYVGLVNSGDCGSWDPEKETVVINARKALV